MNKEADWGSWPINQKPIFTRLNEPKCETGYRVSNIKLVTGSLRQKIKTKINLGQQVISSAKKLPLSSHVELANSYLPNL